MRIVCCLWTIYRMVELYPAVESEPDISQLVARLMTPCVQYAACGLYVCASNPNEWKNYSCLSAKHRYRNCQDFMIPAPGFSHVANFYVWLSFPHSMFTRISINLPQVYGDSKDSSCSPNLEDELLFMENDAGSKKSLQCGLWFADTPI